MRETPIRRLLTGAIDYAGLYPPATLQMAEAVRNYAAYMRGDDRWALGRFVVPVQRLDEFAAAWGDLSEEDAVSWQLAAVLTSEVEPDAGRVREFNDRWTGRVTIDAIEARVTAPEDVQRLADTTPRGAERFAEMAITPALDEILDVARSTGTAAKLRTGGVIPGAFPAPGDVLTFLRGCHRAGVPFKATAGLHHPMRGEYRLTYEPDSPTATMYGYLNLFLAATVVHGGGSDAEALAVLTADATADLEIGADTVKLAGVAFPVRAIAAAREDFVKSFGSCSFREPIDELAQLAVH